MKRVESRRDFEQNGVDITWKNDEKVNLVKKLMTGIRSFLRKWHNTVIPPTGNIAGSAAPERLWFVVLKGFPRDSNVIHWYEIE